MSTPEHHKNRPTWRERTAGQPDDEDVLEGMAEGEVVVTVVAPTPRAAVLKRVALLTLTAVSLYLLFPSIVQVFSSFPALGRIEPWWFLAMGAAEAASFSCTWVVQHVAMRAKRWVPVIESQLAGNAFGRIVPGGGAAAGALQFKMLVEAGVGGARAASGLTVASVMLFAALLALPVLAVPGILLGTPIPNGLEPALYVGIGLFITMFALGAVVLIYDGPLAWIGRIVQRGRNRLWRRREPMTALPSRLLRERDLVVSVVGRRWWQALLATVGKWVLDYLTLLAALTAIGSRPAPSLVLLAYVLAQILGQIPLTPGGLGFVEAGLTATLTLAGVKAGDAVIATLAYRLFSFWLPMPFGLWAWVMHNRRYGGDDREDGAAVAAGAGRP